MEYGVVLTWWVLLVALLGLGVPVASRLVPDARDGGAFVALPLVVVSVTVPLFWLGRLSFGLPVTLGVLAVFAGVSLWSARNGLDVERRALAMTLGVFSAAFLFLLAVRAADPGVYASGGEKFLDYGLLRSLLRGDSLPPEDFWFAGEHVVYYYGGHLVAALFTTLAGTDPRFAYGPALASFYAMAVTAVFGFGRELARRRGYRPLAGGALAALLFGLASNLRPPARVVVTLLPDGLGRWLTGLVGTPYETAVIDPGTFSYWPASRVIPGTINEFPLFAYLNGDLHAHMMSVPVLAAALAVLYAYWHADGAWRRRRLVYGAFPPVLGLLLATNTWSFPTGVGLAWLALALSSHPPRTLLPERVRPSLDGVRAEVARPVVALLLVSPVVPLALAWTWPFVSTVLLAGASKQTLAVLPERSPLGPFVLVHGAFLAVFAAYLARETARDTAARVLAAAVTALCLTLAAFGWLFDLVGLALAGPLVAAGWYALRRRDAGYETMLVVAGAGLVVLVEFVYLNDAAGAGRFNTVFKTYAQVWALWAIAAGVALSGFLPHARDRRTGLRDLDRASAVRVALVALLVCSLCVPYASLSLSRHFADMGDPSLDAFETAEDYHPYEAAAIEWLDANVSGQPTIVSRPSSDVYQWANPASSLTGIPTVAGWVHARNYHDADVYDRRVRDVDFIYTIDSADSRALLLDYYDVQYIYYGPLERDAYGSVSFASEPGIRVAYENEKVTVYAVNQSALAS
ncbi:DUF2298 domain-containing protein [Salarchaeum sp. JOR-1]|uniref:DUF2298 domain-containing protein n=1 Tax=Salarchaeum sp. JOR-1 TaxID=2599399 RepID=UPI0011988D46|nr:DUF2298 domain-containing protein [Salarchaeum sp. JOR-1]QDX41512.1 hypothetical protein FQU85_11590 [Salarchaeum sp. JOR-1]